jgi:hypothetical protein
MQRAYSSDGIVNVLVHDWRNAEFWSPGHEDTETNDANLLFQQMLIVPGNEMKIGCVPW